MYQWEDPITVLTNFDEPLRAMLFTLIIHKEKRSTLPFLFIIGNVQGIYNTKLDEMSFNYITDFKKGS
jgi:hypothetical protein